MSSSHTAVGVFGVIHRLGACERTASCGLESCGWLRSRNDDRSGRSRRLGPFGETILHGCGLSLVRRCADFNDVTMGGSGRRGELGVGRDASDIVSTASGDRRKHGRCSFDPWRWIVRRERKVFFRGGESGVRTRRRHLVELLLLVVRVEGALWPTTSDLGVAGLLLEGVRRRRIIGRGERQRGGRATTRAKRRVGRRRREDDCTRLIRRLSGVTKVVLRLRILVHAGIVGRCIKRTVDHFRITTGRWEVGRRGSGNVIIDDCRVAEPGLAIERSGVEVCIRLTSALATDHPDGEYGDNRDTSQSCGGISSDGADTGAIVCSGGGRRKFSRACRLTGSLGDASDSELLSLRRVSGDFELIVETYLGICRARIGYNNGIGISRGYSSHGGCRRSCGRNCSSGRIGCNNLGGRRGGHRPRRRQNIGIFLGILGRSCLRSGNCRGLGGGVTGDIGCCGG